MYVIAGHAETLSRGEVAHHPDMFFVQVMENAGPGQSADDDDGTVMLLSVLVHKEADGSLSVQLEAGNKDVQTKVIESFNRPQERRLTDGAPLPTPEDTLMVRIVDREPSRG